MKKILLNASNQANTSLQYLNFHFIKCKSDKREMIKYPIGFKKDLYLMLNV